MPDKEFVKAKPLFLKEKGAVKQYRQPRKNKKYEEKQRIQQKDPREGITLMLNSFRVIKNSNIISQLAPKYPKIFSKKNVQPEQDGNFNFNDSLKQAQKRQPRPVIKQLSSDEQPDWDSDCETQVTLESKKIDQAIIKKVQEQVKNRPLKKIGELQKHEKQFIEDYYRHKKLEENEMEKEIPPQLMEIKHAKIGPNPINLSSAVDGWNQYKPQVDELITEGLLEKIEKDDDEDFDDDFQWDTVDEPKKQESEQNSDSSDGDDIFADDQPRTILERKSTSERFDENKQGIVFINNHLFTNIAEKIGIYPETCTWIISNTVDHYKVNTQFMNSIYRQKQMFKAFPFVSLNYSHFVKNEEIESEHALEKFKKFNDRKRPNKKNNQYQQQGNRGKKQYLYKPKQ